MIINRHKYFRWTKRTAFLSFAYVIAVPAFVGYWAFVTDVSFPHSLRCSLLLPCRSCHRSGSGRRVARAKMMVTMELTGA